MEKMLMILIPMMLFGLMLFVSLKRRRGTVATSKRVASDPLAEAEVLIAYGRKRQAIEILRVYLNAEPHNERARTLLIRATD